MTQFAFAGVTHHNLCGCINDVAQRCVQIYGVQLSDQSAMAPKVKNAALKRPASSLKATDLAALGQESLKDKVSRLLANADPSLTAEEKLNAVKAELTKLEISKIWGQRKTAAAHGDQTAKGVDDASGKVEKGKLALAWFIEKKTGVKAFSQLVVSSSASQKVEKREQWRPRKSFVEEFGEDEFEQHLASGRIHWRECIKTRGVFEYQDSEDMVTVKTAQQTKVMEQTQERDDDELMEIMGKDCHLMLQDQSVWKAVPDVKGNAGKGKGVNAGKGKGKGKSNVPLAITNGEDDPKADPVEDTAEEALDKLRKMKSLLSTTCDNYNELLTKVDRVNSKFWSKAAKVSGDAQLKKLTAMIGRLKKMILSPKEATVSSIKKELLGAAELYKSAHQDMKDYKHILTEKKPPKDVKE